MPAKEASMIAAEISLMIVRHRADCWDRKPTPTTTHLDFLVRVALAIDNLRHQVDAETWLLRCEPVRNMANDVHAALSENHNSDSERKLGIFLDFAQEVVMLLTDHLTEKELRATAIA